MSLKKNKQPSSIEIIIKDRIFHLFNQLHDRKELSDPRELSIRAPLDSGKENENLDHLVNESDQQWQNGSFFLDFDLPSPDPEKSMIDNLNKKRIRNVFSDLNQLIGYYATRDESGKASHPFTKEGNKILSHNTITPQEIETEKTFLKELSLVSQISGTNYQVLLELRLDPEKHELTSSEKIFVRSVLDCLLTILDRSI